MHPFNQRIQSALAARQSQGLYRSRTCLERQDCQVLATGSLSQASSPHHAKRCLNFSSNDYLGLAQSPALVEAWQQGLTRYGAGSGASPLVTGYQPAHHRLEKQLADWLGYDRALLFSSGFGANQALLFTLLQKGDLLIQDKLNHASLMEAGMLSEATMRRFAHNDTDALAQLLAKQTNVTSAETVKMVVTEGVFSMDGDCAPLSAMQTLCHAHQSLLAVDDAHGCGVLGDEGRGSCDQAGIRPDILVVTFGKAFGLQGAAILCNEDLAEYLVQFARHYIYSTAIPPAQAHALSQACSMIQQQHWRREKLQELGHILAEALDPAVELVATDTPIKPVLVGDSQRAVAMSEQLRDRGIWVSAIRPPTVPVNSSRLRITLTANHEPSDIRQLANAINEVFHAQ